MKAYMTFDEDDMVEFLKDILCLNKGMEWKCITMSSDIIIRHNGNIYNVRQKILEWLTTPERLDQTTALGKQIRSGNLNSED